MNIFKKTKSVTLILDSFFNEKEALSIIELVDKFANKMNKTTVYRILERLEEASILHSFVDQNGLKRYAKNNKNLDSLMLILIIPIFYVKTVVYLFVYL